MKDDLIDLADGDDVSIVALVAERSNNHSGWDSPIQLRQDSSLDLGNGAA